MWRIIKFIWTRYKIFFIIIFLIFTTLFFANNSKTGFTSKVQSIFYNSIRQVLKYETSILEEINTCLFKINLIVNHTEKLKNLLETNKILEAELTRLKFIELEYNSLKKLVAHNDFYLNNIVFASTISSSDNIFKKLLIIEPQKISDVIIGNIVINDKGMIGRIIDKNSHTAEVMSITDINSKIPAITGTSHFKIIAAGNGSERLDIQYLTDYTAIINEEYVYTSGDDKFLPPGIIIGQITVQNNKVQIIPLAKWYDSYFVQIITKIYNES